MEFIAEEPTPTGPRRIEMKCECEDSRHRDPDSVCPNSVFGRREMSYSVVFGGKRGKQRYELCAECFLGGHMA